MAFLGRRKFRGKRKFRGRRRFRKRKKFMSSTPRRLYCEPCSFEQLTAGDVVGDTTKKAWALTQPTATASDLTALAAKNWTYVNTVNKGAHNLNQTVRKFKFSVYVEHELNNKSNATMQVTIYEIQYRRDLAKAIVDPSAADYGLATTKTLWNSDSTTAAFLGDGASAPPGGTTSLANYYDYPYWTPFKSGTYCEFVKILKKKTVQIPAGGRFKLTQGSKARLFSENYFESLSTANVQAIGKYTKQFLIGFHGQIANTGVAGAGNIGYATTELNWVTKRIFKVQTVLNAPKLFDFVIPTLYQTNEATAPNALKVPVQGVFETVAGIEVAEGHD